MKKAFFILSLLLSFVSFAFAENYQFSTDSLIAVKIFYGSVSSFEFKYKDSFPNVMQSTLKEGDQIVFEPNELVIPAERVRSWVGLANETLLQVVKADEHPNMKVVISELAPMSNDEMKDGDSLNYRLIGTLCIAGVCQSLNCPVKLKQKRNWNQIEVEGLYQSTLSSFNMVPPIVMGGFIKVKDPFEVRFRLEISKIN